MMHKNRCLMCNAKEKHQVFAYNLGKYKILHCNKCHSTYVENMPDEETLKNFYDGFMFCINDNNKSKIINEDFNQWFISLGIKAGATMLDIGGAGGFFSKSFETYINGGKATLVDMDIKACEYAKKLGISEVINDDVRHLSKKINQKFDFIYCRHLIEHLVNPTEIIDSALDMLSDDGVFILHFPNGLSYASLLNTKKYKEKINLIKESNPGFSNFMIFKLLHSKTVASGLDPIRHLWSISPKGISMYLKNKNVNFKIRTYSLTNKIYSPYYGKENLFQAIKRELYSIPNGREHLVVEIRKRRK